MLVLCGRGEFDLQQIHTSECSLVLNDANLRARVVRPRRIALYASAIVPISCDNHGNAPVCAPCGRESELLSLGRPVARLPMDVLNRSRVLESEACLRVSVTRQATKFAAQ